jgi:TM2 domain-containing membrane protein YozV
MKEEKVKRVAKHFEKSFPMEGYENFKRTLALVPDGYYDNIMATPMKKTPVTVILAIFLGMFGIDRFYIGDKKMGIIKLVATVVITLCSIFIPNPTIVAVLEVALGIFLIVDIFLSYKEGKRNNYDAVNKKIHNFIAKERAAALAEREAEAATAE